RRSHDRIDRARGQALGAANATLLVDEGHGGRRFEPVVLVERLDGKPGECREFQQRFGTTGRTLVDGRLATGDGVRVGTATRESATRALRLRQKCIDGPG